MIALFFYLCLIIKYTFASYCNITVDGAHTNVVCRGLEGGSAGLEELLRNPQIVSAANWIRDISVFGVNFTVSKDVLAPFPNVKRLTISGGVHDTFDRSTLQDGALAHFTKLEILDLDGFDFPNDTGALFEPLRDTLEKLVIDSSTLRSADALQECTKLKKLIIDDSGLLELPKFQKSGQALIAVWIRHNDVQIVKREHFRGVTSLRRLHLNHNQISYIEQGAFDDMALMTLINLECNKLGTLPENVFKNTLELRDINLAGNPFHGHVTAANFSHLPKLEYVEKPRDRSVSSCTEQ